jgi:hypothetical protein
MKCELCGRKEQKAGPFSRPIILRAVGPYKVACQLCVPIKPEPVRKPEPLTTDPKHPGINKTKENGQNETYLVLSDEERAKGFIRPVRRSYIHVGVRPKYPLRGLTAEEHERYDKFKYHMYEEYPKGSDSLGRYWTKEQLNSGCKAVTTMGQAIAETYARDPKFYGATFCCGCNKHIRVDEFVWDGTEERVGS